MLIISEKQLRALEQAGADGFHARLCDFICAEYNVEAARRPALEVGIATAIKDGHAFGLRSEKAMATYGVAAFLVGLQIKDCLLYTSPSPRDRTRSRMPSSA